jgi:hypothetical protein
LAVAVYSPDTSAIITPPGKSYVKVYYFHGDRRCKTCNTIEDYSKAFVRNNFNKSLENGDLAMEIVNYDKEENEHYTEMFDLFNQALIIVRYEDGKMKEWKNLPKIWEYVSDENKFEKYVVKEIRKYLKKL